MSICRVSSSDISNKKRSRKINLCLKSNQTCRIIGSIINMHYRNELMDPHWFKHVCDTKLLLK